MMKKNFRTGCIPLVILFWALPVFAREQPPARVVVTEIISREVAENRSYIGTIQYDRTSNISADVTGLVKEVLVREAGRVREGDELVRLDTEILDKEIELNRTRIEQITLRIDLAKKNLERLNTLLDRKVTSVKNYDDAVHAHQDALVDKKAAELELEKLLIEKRKSVIRAPYAGVILSKNIDSGDWVQEGTSLLTIAASRELVVEAPVEEALLQFVKPGQEVPVIVNAYQRELAGTILRINPTADARTKNVFLVISIPPLDDVAANMSATVYIATSGRRQLSIIPRDALVQFEGRNFVYTVKEGKAVMLPVNIVTYLGNMIGADDPALTEGTIVIIEGNERLRPDQPVMIEQAR